MKISAIAIALCVAFSSKVQMPPFEKQALALVQNMPVSNLDTDLPQRPFATWLSQVVGPQAGIVWQLTECGERIIAPGETAQDLPACMEVIASLANNRKVIVVITVGTFKKGLTGKPAFFRAVVERGSQLIQIRRLSDVPKMLSERKDLPVSSAAKKRVGRPVNLPVVNANRAQISFPSQSAQLLFWSLSYNFVPNALSQEEIPPQPVSKPIPKLVSPQLQKVTEMGLRASAIIRVKPIYPRGAKLMNAFGPVKVQVMISEAGVVTSANAVSGHIALRVAAVEAAYKWVFKSIIINGMPVKAEGILTFEFSPGVQ